MQRWAKAIGVGLLGSLAMFLLMMVGIHGVGAAPFNIPPSAAFLEAHGLNFGPLPLVVHFGYGAFWSAVLVALYGSDTTPSKGLGLAGILWLGMMLVYTPIIGWGLFGFVGTPELEPTATLFLESGPKYAFATLILHAVYGSLVGWLNGAWID